MTLRAVNVCVSRACLLLLAYAAAADEDALVREIVRQVCCAETTRISQYDLGPLLALSGQDAGALVGAWEIPEETFARLERERAIWTLCALLDHKRPETQARAAEALAALADPRTAPVLWLHGQRHYVAYAEGTPGARTRAALTAARAAIGMEAPPNGLDYLVKRWLTPETRPAAVEKAAALQQRIDAREKVAWEDVLRLFPPAGEIAVAGSWRWYPIDDGWTLASFVHYGVRRIRVDPRLPESTSFGPMPRIGPLPEPTAEEATKIGDLVRELNNPAYVNATPEDLPGFISGPMLPRRRAAWDLLPYGDKLATALIPRLAELDEDGGYAARYTLWRVFGDRYRGYQVVTGDRRAEGATGLGRDAAGAALGWQAWLDLVRAGVPRGGLAIRLRDARVLPDGDAELDYAIGWFGADSAWLAFPEGRPAAIVTGVDREGVARNLRVVERYETHGGMPMGPNSVLLGRFLVPGGASLAGVRVRLSVPPGPPPIRHAWSGTVESNEVFIPR